MPASTADILSNDPARLLRWLCNHWRHKFEIERRDDNHARIPLGDIGTAEFSVSEGRLHAYARTDDASQLPRLEQVIETHLQRFARDEPLRFEWVAQD